MQFKIISLDLDGTLLNDKKEISRRNVDSIIKFQKEGGFIVLTSSRKFRDIESYARQLELYSSGRGFIISSAGLYLHNLKTGEVEKTETFNKESIKNVANSLLGAFTELACILVASDYDYIIYRKYSLFLRIKNLYFWLTRKNVRIIPLSAIEEINDSIEKIMIYTIDTERINQSLGKIPQVYARTIDKNRTEILFYTVSKSNALQKLIEKLSISNNSVLVFGDDENDLDCFEKFENTVAMGNAIESIKAKSKYITKSNNDDGISSFMEKDLIH